MKKYEIEYKDCTGMRCRVEQQAVHEKTAIQILQQDLIEDGDYMTQLIDIQEVKYVNDIHDGEIDDGEWTLEDGTPLDENDQELLNYAFDTYVNEDGKTIKQVIDGK